MKWHIDVASDIGGRAEQQDRAEVFAVPNRPNDCLVVLAEGAEASEQDLIDHCRDRMAHYKCPTSVEFRDELARTATGKLQKFKLRAPYWEGMEKAVN